ncbi:MAG TPA: hypothetical protein VIK71_03065 [Flavobacteriales bacterium]|jgi:hypothetical protein
MKNFKFTLLALVAVTLLASSCTSYKHSVPVAPMFAQVNFSIEDLEFIGEAVGTAEQSYVIGLPIGGRKYHTAATSQLNGGLNIIPNDRGYNNALYDAMMKFPNADFVLPVSVNTTTSHQFLGRRETVTVRFKAYRIKNK